MGHPADVGHPVLVTVFLNSTTAQPGWAIWRGSLERLDHGRYWGECHRSKDLLET